MVLTYEGVPLVISDPLRDVLDPKPLEMLCPCVFHLIEDFFFFFFFFFLFATFWESIGYILKVFFLFFFFYKQHIV